VPKSFGRELERSRVARSDEWVRVERTSAFKELMRKKKAFIVPAMIFFFVFYFTLPFLTAFTTVLNATAFGPISWAYVYAFAQFIMTWGLAYAYIGQANKWDDLVDRARHEAAQGSAGRDRV
jgi:uncharacterized membrane protein (DUF485 family)